MPRYNALNRINVNLEAAGICAVCGQRLSVCEHATPEQAERTRQMDAAIDTEYAMRSQYALAAAMITDVAPRLELALSIISDLELDGSLPSRVELGCACGCSRCPALDGLGKNNKLE